MGIDEIKSRIMEVKDNPIRFTVHSMIRLRERPISVEEVIELFRSKLDSLKSAEPQDDEYDNVEKYRVCFEKNRKHDILVIFKILNENIVIITVVRTSRKWQSKIKQKKR